MQSRLAECALERHVHVADSPAILMGRIFDDRGNRMTPSHSNKAGVRYRYYVSHALLQRRKDEAGGVARVPAAQVEATIVEAVRQSFRNVTDGGAAVTSAPDRGADRQASPSGGSLEKSGDRLRAATSLASQ